MGLLKDNEKRLQNRLLLLSKIAGREMASSYPRRKITSDVDEIFARAERELQNAIATEGFDPRDRDSGTLEEWRRNFGRSHALRSEILVLIDEALDALVDGSETEVNKRFQAAYEKYKELASLNLIERLLWVRREEAAQEIAEFAITRWGWGLVRYAGARFKGTLPLWQELGITFESWLSGLLDVPGEVGRTLNILLADYEVPEEDEMKFRSRLYGLDKIIVHFCRQYLLAYDQTIKNNDRRDWRSKFKGKFDSMLGVVNGHREWFIRSLKKRNKE